MDPFDEFEFKPLTDGLGFHKKTVTLKEQVKNSGLAAEHLQELPTSIPRFAEDLVPKKVMSFEDVIGSLEKAPLKPSIQGKNFLEITEPLPRTSGRDIIKTLEVEMPQMPPKPRAPVQSPFPTKELFRQPNAVSAVSAPKTALKKELANTGMRRGAPDSPIGQLVATNASVPSALLDLIVVTAVSLIFMAAMISVTKMDLGNVLRAAQAEPWTMTSLVVAFLMIMQIYVVVARAFFGRTLGEFTFDVQLGRAEDQQQEMYPVKVVGRSALITCSGLLTLPLLSLILGRDVAGQVTGTQLYQQR